MYCKCSMPHASSANGTINIRPYSAVFCVSVMSFFVISFDILQTINISFYVMFVWLFIRIKEIWSGSESVRELESVPLSETTGIGDALKNLLKELRV